MHNTCEDSLLASPLMLDLVILCELCERIQIKKLDNNTTNNNANNLDTSTSSKFENFHPVLSLLSYLLKAPLVPPGMPVINALNAQRLALINVFRACIGLAPENYMLLEHRLPSLIMNCQNAMKIKEKEVEHTTGEATVVTNKRNVITTTTETDKETYKTPTKTRKAIATQNSASIIAFSLRRSQHGQRRRRAALGLWVWPLDSRVGEVGFIYLFLGQE